MKIYNFAVEDIDGCEFVKSKSVGSILVSFEHDEMGFPTGNILVVYADGSHTVISDEKAQNKFDSDEWVVIR